MTLKPSATSDSSSERSMKSSMVQHKTVQYLMLLAFIFVGACSSYGNPNPNDPNRVPLCTVGCGGGGGSSTFATPYPTPYPTILYTPQPIPSYYVPQPYPSVYYPPQPYPTYYVPQPYPTYFIPQPYPSYYVPIPQPTTAPQPFGEFQWQGDQTFLNFYVIGQNGQSLWPFPCFDRTTGATTCDNSYVPVLRVWTDQIAGTPAFAPIIGRWEPNGSQMRAIFTGTQVIQPTWPGTWTFEKGQNIGNPDFRIPQQLAFLDYTYFSGTTIAKFVPKYPSSIGPDRRDANKQNIIYRLQSLEGSTSITIPPVFFSPASTSAKAS